MNHLAHFFLPPDSGLPLVEGYHHMGMVALSVLVPILMSMMALQTAQMARVTANQKYKRIALTLGAVALGMGVWVMHFIAMMAFVLPVPVTYDLGLTVFSILPACVASGIALRILSQRRHPTVVQYIVSALCVGVGIGLMHYIGMMAMIVPLKMYHEPILFVTSLVLAVGLALLALWIRFGLEQFQWHPIWRFIISGVVMGCAVSGMHYTAMLAVRFHGTHTTESAQGIWVHTSIIAIGLSSIVLTIGVMVVALNGWVRSHELYGKMQRNKFRLQALLETTVDPIVVINEHGIIRDFNRAVQGFLGYTASELIGQNVKILMPEPYRSEHDGYLENYRRTQQAKIIGAGREVVAQHKNGRCIPIRLAVGKVDRYPGEEQLFVGLITDISERRALEASLRETATRAEQAALVKSRFLANMSHEIRTPINAIVGFSELLQQTDLSETQRSYLNNVTHSSRSLLRLINDILDTTKIEEGKVELEITDFSLKAIAAQLESSMGLSAKKAQLDFQVRYLPTMPEYFVGDGGRVMQVLNNLVGNAIKFTENGGVYVDFSYDGQEVCVEIVDTGIGMTPQQLETIFEPFSQADASINRRFGGTGLGTTIARQLTEAMGGRMEVVSEVDQGTRFSVFLPLRIGQKKTPPQPAFTPTLSPKRILIVDDVEQNLRLLRLILERHGHTVTEAKDGHEAVKLYHRDAYDLILMDMHMPGMDGLQATQIIRQHERQHQQPRMPIIALTASVMTEDRQRAAAAGMDGFAVKPLDIEQLFGEMGRIFSLQPEVSRTTIQRVPVQNHIDWERGAQHLGSRAVLEAELQRFLQQPLAQPLSVQQARGYDFEALQLHIHSLRGVAANLYLPILTRLCAEFEELLQHQKIEKVFSRWDELSEALDQVRLAISEASSHAPKTPASALRAQWDASLYQQLQATLEKNEYDDALIRQVCAQLSASQAQALRLAIDAFDFERASALLKQWQTPT